MSKDRKKFEALLLKMREDLKKLMDSAKDSTCPVELDQTMVGRLSRMDAMQQQQMALASERRRQQTLKNIDKAMERIATGDYGYCIICDEHIEEKRLLINPTVLTCIQCASK